MLRKHLLRPQEWRGISVRLRMRRQLLKHLLRLQAPRAQQLARLQELACLPVRLQAGVVWALG
jgi:hypothetical protein